MVDEVNVDEENEFDEILHTPKRRKLKTTSRYIFETLFVEGQDSDITLFALNREWKLHKVKKGRFVNTIEIGIFIFWITPKETYLIFYFSSIYNSLRIFDQCSLVLGKNQA